jgi:hypothetical protein
VFAGPASLLGFALYLWRTTGDGLAWSHAERAWGRSFSLTGPWHAFLGPFTIWLHPTNAWLFRDVASCAVYLGCLAIAWRAGLPRSWIVAGILIVCLPIGTGSFTSDSRFGLLAIAAYWGLAVAARRQTLHWLICIVSPLLLVINTGTIWYRWP